MEKDVIRLTLEFLKRVDLKGSEVPAFNKVYNELFKLLQEIENKEQE